MKMIFPYICKGEVNLKISLLEWPDKNDWFEVKRRCLKTMGMNPKSAPDSTWKHRILESRHSPIRYLRFSFSLESIPYWVACELRTHVHDMPYVADFGVYIRSQRNDRQNKYDRSTASQSAPVDMIIDCNAEQIQILANKRLCAKASAEARAVVMQMCYLAEEKCLEFKGLLVPMCEHCGGVCHEFEPCGRCSEDEKSF